MFLSDILNVPYTVTEDIENDPGKLEEIKQKLHNPNRKIFVDSGKVKKLLKIDGSKINLIMDYTNGIGNVIDYIKTPEPIIDVNKISGANIDFKTKSVKLENLNRTFIPFKNLENFDLDYVSSNPNIDIEKLKDGIAIVPKKIIKGPVTVSLKLKQPGKMESKFDFTIQPENNISEEFDFKFVNDDFQRYSETLIGFNK